MGRPHSCHVPSCKASCPPRHLYCATHWRMVSPETQREVYRTVKLRVKRGCDHTWAPWWRAQAQAEFEVAEALGTVDTVAERRLTRALAFADKLEASAPGQLDP